MQQTCSCPDCCHGCLSVSTAALLLVSSAMPWNLSLGSELKAHAIAASSAEYGFCSDLMPSIEEKVSILEPPCTDVKNWVAPLTPTTSFHAKLLMAMCTAQLESACLRSEERRVGKESRSRSKPSSR